VFRYFGKLYVEMNVWRHR